MDNYELTMKVDRLEKKIEQLEQKLSELKNDACSEIRSSVYSVRTPEPEIDHFLFYR